MASIQGVYVALFGRPADPTGLAYFNAATNNGANLTAIGDLASTAEYKERFKDKDNNQIVTAIYQSLFNRDPDADGLNFFVNALNTGSLNINNIAIAILDGAQGSDKTIVDAKIASANAFTTALDTPVEVAAYAGKAGIDAGVAFLTGITTTAKTAAEADAAVKTLVDSGNAGNAAIVLANGGANDIVVGTTAANTTDKNDTITAAAGNWVAADKIDGGFGNDTFNVTVDANVTVLAGNIKSVENFNITATTAAVVNLKEAVGVTHVTNNASTAALTVEGLALSTVTTIKGATTGVTTFGFEGVSGTADAKTIVADAATAAGVTVAGIEALTISSTGGSTLGTVTAADATSITLAGSGALSLTIDAAKATSVTNTSTGDVTVNLSAALKLATYTGSAASDIVTLDNAGLGANVAISTGAGADQLIVSAGAASEYAITLSGGAGSDKFVVKSATNVHTADAANFLKSLITVADFSASEDVLDVAGIARTTLDNFQMGSITGKATLFEAVSQAATFGGQTVFVFGGDTYLVSDTNGDNTFNAGDGLVKVTGLTDLASLTAANFAI